MPLDGEVRVTFIFMMCGLRWGGGGVRRRGALVLMQLRGKCHLKSGSFGGRDGLSHWEVGILTVKNEVLGEWVTLKIIGGHLKFFVRLFIIPPPPHQK